MAHKVLILGDSGTGKSASLRNFKPDEVMVINCAGKPLPFKNHFESITPAFDKVTQDVLNAMDSTDKKVIVIDDAQYIMSFQYMRRIKENGWDKWNDIQGDFFNIIKHADFLPSDTIVYFLSHLQRDDEGHEKIKTMGKMLDEKITIEGLFTIVLKTSVADGQYYFLTQNSGMDTVKSPIGMFDTYAVDNDLKYIDTKIRNYYEIGDYASDEVVKQMDAESEKPDLEKPAADGKKRRRKKEPKTDDSGFMKDENMESDDNKTTSGRKGRTVEKEEKPAEAPSEEKKEETDAEETVLPRRKVHTDSTEGTGNAVKESDGVIPIEAEKTRRKRRRKVQTDADGFKDVNDEDLPFH